MIVLEKPGKFKTSKTEKCGVPVMNGEEVYGNKLGKKETIMKTIKVVAAVIQAGDRILATKRGYGDLINKWEFPGGKIKEGEKPSDALKREIEEELKAEIIVHDLLTIVEYDYPDFHLSMQCFLCELPGGKFELIEHNDAKWLHKNELKELDWCPADIKVVDAILNKN